MKKIGLTLLFLTACALAASILLVLIPSCSGNPRMPPTSERVVDYWNTMWQDGKMTPEEAQGFAELLQELSDENSTRVDWTELGVACVTTALTTFLGVNVHRNQREKKKRKLVTTPPATSSPTA